MEEEDDRIECGKIPDTSIYVQLSDDCLLIGVSHRVSV